jgi:hypothetical protein
MEMTNKPPVKIVDDLRQLDLIHPTPRIKDNLSKLDLPDLTIRPVEPPELLSVDPNTPIINPKTDLNTKDDLKLGTKILDPKKKFLMKK